MNDAPSPPSDPRQRLLLAVITQIEAHGLAQITVRGIAAAAEVNHAAVNYYFRSKEALVAAALESSARHMIEDSERYLEGADADPEGALTELFAYYLDGARRYPRTTRAQLHDAFAADDYSGPFPTLFAPLVAKMRDVVRRLVPGLGAAEASRRVVAALSSVFFPAYFMPLWAPLGALDTPKDQKAYVREVARRLLTPPEAPSRARRPRP
jgi:AcrR family transcriptional regulator